MTNIPSMDSLMVQIGTRCPTCQGNTTYVPQGRMLPVGCRDCENTGAQNRKWVPMDQFVALVKAAIDEENARNAS